MSSAGATQVFPIQKNKNITSIDEFETYLEYCRNLRFEEKPDYAWVKNLFTNLYYKHEDQWDNVFDWSYIKVNCPPNQK